MSPNGSEYKKENTMKHTNNEEQLKRAAEYVALQCTGCQDSPQILALKAFEVMKTAVEKRENPYKALNDFLGTTIPEDTLRGL